MSYYRGAKPRSRRSVPGCFTMQRPGLTNPAQLITFQPMINQCRGPGCGVRKIVAHGLCASHYQQMRRGKELKPVFKHGSSNEDRFWRHVRKFGDEPDDCWIWMGGGRGKGRRYGQFVLDNGINKLAHRYSYELTYEVELTPSQPLDHTCRNTKCVKPSHLEITNNTVNTKRMLGYQAVEEENRILRELLKANGIIP